jgi:hypothetical protein
MRHLLSIALLLLISLGAGAQNWGNFEVESAEPRSKTQIDQLVAQLSNNPFPKQKLEILRKDVASSSLGYTGEQVVQILLSFESSTEKGEAIKIMDESILGMNSQNVIEAISTAKFASHKLEILEALRSTITDDDKRYTILDAFSTNRDKALAKAILDRIISPRSFIYGTIISKNVAFVIDFSGSMEASFTLSNNQTVNRLQFVTYELAKAMKIVPSDTRIDLVMFSTNVDYWKGKLVPATDNAKAEALVFESRFKPEGATNIYGALKNAFEDPKVETIYFLTDGTPTSGDVTDESSILSAVAQWNQGRNVRIHTCSFVMGNFSGDDKMRSKTFMKKLADQTKGVYRAFE